jgi:hypothetical protein
MLTLNVNGNEQKLNIGCRTFISLYELLHLLDLPSGGTLSIQVNNETILQNKHMLHNISNGDHLIIDSSTTQ